MDPKASIFADALIKACRKTGFEPNVVFAAKDAITVLGLVSANQGTALLPESLQQIAWPRVVFRPIAEPVLPADLYMVSRHGDPSGAVVNFVELARLHAPPVARQKAGSRAQPTMTCGRLLAPVALTQA